MYNTVSDKQIDNEIESRYRPHATNASIRDLPLCELSDRDFEILTYQLIKEEIANNEHNGYDSISLMQGIGERGRDCVIYSNDEVVAVVQCKKYKSNITRPALLKELIKFLLHLTIDESLFSGNKVKYLFYVSKSLNEPAIKLTNQFSKEVLKDINEGKVKGYIKAVVDEYASFEGYVGKEPYEAIESLLMLTTVEVHDQVDLSYRIQCKPNILQNFFDVVQVIDRDAFNEDLTRMFERYGLADQSDIDIKHLQKRIKPIGSEKRTNFGAFDFYGYDIEFLKYLKNDEFSELFQLISNVSLFMNKKLFSYLSSKITELTYKEVTNKLLNNNIIHPYSINVVTMYLSRRCSRSLVSGTIPEKLHQKYYPEHYATKDQLIGEVLEYLLDSSERFMGGDYSLIKGTKEEIRFKVNVLFPKLHEGFTTITDVRSRAERDLIILEPVIDKIETEIIELLESEKTIIIKNSEMFSDKEMLPKIKNTFDSLRDN
ncbi:TPA: restriction endonuclease [Photobacterium damselae]